MPIGFLIFSVGVTGSHPDTKNQEPNLYQFRKTGLRLSIPSAWD
jgi:hypothetical protein